MLTDRIDAENAHMWLLYLRFDDGGVVKTNHVRTGSKADVLELLQLAEQHGLTPSSKLIEDASFPVSGHIKRRGMMAPNFHFYDHLEFVERCWTLDAPGACVAGTHGRTHHFLIDAFCTLEQQHPRCVTGSQG